MALIPPFFLNCVVAIGVINSKNEKTWIGTGFLVGRYYKTIETEKKYHIFLVTNKHILNGNKSIIVRFNPQNSEQATDFNIDIFNEKGEFKWTGHPNPNIDVATININPLVLNERGMLYRYFRSDEHLLDTRQMNENGTSEGDFVYVMGFTMGLIDPERQYVIVRSGIIARLRDLLDKRRQDFLVDAFVFPGNSGGPVIIKPETTSITGTKIIERAALIGIITSYLPYNDIAYSKQTNRPRVIFEENTGLSIALPVDYIMETIEICFQKLKIVEDKIPKQ